LHNNKVEKYSILKSKKKNISLPQYSPWANYCKSK